MIKVQHGDGLTTSFKSNVPDVSTKVRSVTLAKPQTENTAMLSTEALNVSTSALCISTSPQVRRHSDAGCDKVRCGHVWERRTDWYT